MQNTNTKVLLALTLGMFLWASSFTAFKLAFQYYNWAFVVFGRMLVASIFFILIYKRIKPKNKLSKEQIKLIILLGLFEPCLYFLFETLALNYTSATQASMISATLPLLVGVGAWFFFKEKLSAKNWLGFILAAFGVIWISLANDSSNINEMTKNPLLGNFLEFIAMLFAMFYTLLLRKLATQIDTWFLTATQVFLGSIFFLPFIFFINPQTGIYADFSFTGLGIIIYLGLAVSVVAYGIYNWGISKIGAAKAAGLVNLIPIMSVFIAYFLLKETLNLEQILAGFTIILGVSLSQISTKKTKLGKS